MASVYMRFLPPERDDIVSLHIFEASTLGGSATEIEVVTDIGDFPDYISEYTTDQAQNPNHWFSIQWADAKGALTDMSQQMQGGTESLVSEITDRVMLRDPALDQTVVAQEAEAVICLYYGTTDPYSIDRSTVPPNILTGLTMLTQAYCYMVGTVTSGAGSKWVAGLVSLDTTVSYKSIWDNIDRMVKAANLLLGRNYSTILLMQEIDVAKLSKPYSPAMVGFDVSRLMIEIS